MKHLGCLNIKASGIITSSYRPTPSRGNQDVNKDVIITDCFQLAEYSQEGKDPAEQGSSPRTPQKCARLLLRAALGVPVKLDSVSVEAGPQR